jgi:hypothetical protein
MADEAISACAWCGEVAVTEVVTRPGRNLRKTAPVCERHAEDFELRGMMTVRVEADQKLEAERKRSQWAKTHRYWR